MMKAINTILCLAWALCWGVPVSAGDVLDKVKKQGYVECGVSQGVPGFSAPDGSGQWRGLDVDACRAVAAAVLGDANKTKFRPLSAKERFTALQSGEIDVLARNTTWTADRALSMGLRFTAVVYYDGQGFMVRKSQSIHSVKDLNGATLCVNAGTTTELNVADFFRTNKMTYKILTFADIKETMAAYDAGRCDVLSADRSALAGQRFILKNPFDHVLLPDTISKEPLSPAVRQGDDQWFEIVQWAFNVMLLGEELGVSSKNIDELKQTSTNPEIKRLLGEADFAAQLTIEKGWAYRILKQVGNYAESFERNVGTGSPINLPRGMNAGWKQGGLMYAPPFR